MIRYNIRDKTAVKPRGVHHKSTWDNDTRLPTGVQYRDLDSDTGRSRGGDSVEQQDDE